MKSMKRCKLLENADWLMKAPHGHKDDFDALIEMSKNSDYSRYS